MIVQITSTESPLIVEQFDLTYTDINLTQNHIYYHPWLWMKYKAQQKSLAVIAKLRKTQPSQQVRRQIKP